MENNNQASNNSEQQSPYNQQIPADAQFGKIPQIDLNKYRQSTSSKPTQKTNKTLSGFKPPASSTEEQYQAQPEIELTPQEKRRQEFQHAASHFKQEALTNASFSYLDVFEYQMRQKREAQNEFYSNKEEEDKENDSKVPAYFRKHESEPQSSDPMFDDQQDQNLALDADGNPRRLSRKAEEVQAWKNLQSQMDMDFDPDTKSQEELREFFKISKEKNAIDHMNEKIFEYLYDRMKDRQIKFYAFLNKEFNIMNYKSARCSYHCFDTTDRPLKQVNECLSLCRDGLNGCRDFALNLQKGAELDVEKCQTEAQTMKKQNLTDPIIHWISCYEKLILRFDSMEVEIKEEFGNFI